MGGYTEYSRYDLYNIPEIEPRRSRSRSRSISEDSLSENKTSSRSRSISEDSYSSRKKTLQNFFSKEASKKRKKISKSSHSSKKTASSVNNINIKKDIGGVFTIKLPFEKKKSKEKSVKSSNYFYKKIIQQKDNKKKNKSREENKQISSKNSYQENKEAVDSYHSRLDKFSFENHHFSLNDSPLDNKVSRRSCSSPEDSYSSSQEHSQDLFKETGKKRKRIGGLGYLSKKTEPPVKKIKKDRECVITNQPLFSKHKLKGRNIKFTNNLCPTTLQCKNNENKKTSTSIGNTKIEKEETVKPSNNRSKNDNNKKISYSKNAEIHTNQKPALNKKSTIFKNNKEGARFWQDKKYEEAINLWKQDATDIQTKDLEKIKGAVFDENYQKLDYTFQEGIKKDIDEKIEQLREQVESVIQSFQEAGQKERDQDYIDNIYSNKKQEKDSAKEAPVYQRKFSFNQ